MNRFTTDISKHLMLLFIPEKIPTSKHSEYFKTSYVIVYPISGIYYPHRTVISKHLMLLFINDADYIFVRDEIISKHLMLLFICSIDSTKVLHRRIAYFKTSYVIVYLKDSRQKPESVPF